MVVLLTKLTICAGSSGGRSPDRMALAVSLRFGHSSWAFLNSSRTIWPGVPDCGHRWALRWGFRMPPNAWRFSISLSLIGPSFNAGPKGSSSLQGRGSRFSSPACQARWNALAMASESSAVYSPWEREARSRLPSGPTTHLCTADWWEASYLEPSGFSKVLFGWLHLSPSSCSNSALCSMIFVGLVVSKPVRHWSKWTDFIHAQASSFLMLGINQSDGRSGPWSGFSRPNM